MSKGNSTNHPDNNEKGEMREQVVAKVPIISYSSGYGELHYRPLQVLIPPHGQKITHKKSVVVLTTEITPISGACTTFMKALDGAVA